MMATNLARAEHQDTEGTADLGVDRKPPRDPGLEHLPLLNKSLGMTSHHRSAPKSITETLASDGKKEQLQTRAVA
jgi:hypothetical protein